MKSNLECIPCFVRQTLECVRQFTDDTAIHERVLRKVLLEASRMNLDKTPPQMAQHIHRLIRRETGLSDPYQDIKRRFNRTILSMYASLKTRIAHSADPLETAVRLAIAGNIIDLGVNAHVDGFIIHDAIDRTEIDPLIWNRQEFFDAMTQARSILYLADNAGEIVFDRLLIEELPLGKITVAVRGYPILNDAIRTDAKEVGLDALVEIIDNGSDAPGTILNDCSEVFVKRFQEADMVIAKGQGNYETLSDVDKDIFFLLKAKCPVIARHIGCKVGDMVFRRSVSTIRTEKMECDR